MKNATNHITGKGGGSSRKEKSGSICNICNPDLSENGADCGKDVSKKKILCKIRGVLQNIAG